jgi:ribosome-binding ATPase
MNSIKTLNGNHPRRPRHVGTSNNASKAPLTRKKILVLHGNRQTGALFLGRIERLRKKLLAQCQIELVAIDAPLLYDDTGDDMMRTWWHRDPHTNDCTGVSASMQRVQAAWDAARQSPAPYIGLLGFSQGARLVHLLTMRHAWQPTTYCQGLQLVIQVAGYEAPWPEEFCQAIPEEKRRLLLDGEGFVCSVPSLHVWGERDQLVTPEQSSAVAQLHYSHPSIHIHDGGHHMPMRAADVQTYIQFITTHLQNTTLTSILLDATMEETAVATIEIPDEECAIQQRDEVEALQAIYPEEFHFQSEYTIDVGDGTVQYQYPISYKIDLIPTDEEAEYWPPHPISVKVTYPSTYPNTVPTLALVHENNGVQFTSSASSACVQAIQDAATEELGMPRIMSCLFAARDCLARHSATNPQLDVVQPKTQEAGNGIEDDAASNETGFAAGTIKPASKERIHECNLQGLEIAEQILSSRVSGFHVTEHFVSDMSSSNSTSMVGKGGSWSFTIGLVGKPSAGKSTFFNTATGFARQRQSDAKTASHEPGAAMAPHPFTTISPNVGYCLVPAPAGSCPEDAVSGNRLTNGDKNIIGSSHGRDGEGRRFLPILLKDVAGLVPGAYQGRGRGNQFLNDLCDADVLIHVCDASGTSDSEGNLLVTDDPAENGDQTSATGGSNPLDDMAWIRNELIEWVYTNLIRKWDTIRKKGRTKLEGMFSGYGQPMAMTWNVLNAMEQYMVQTQTKLVRPLEQLDEWDEADVHRLVSAFLGVRFPIALALNKMDVPSSKLHIERILADLPIHGTRVGTPLSAKQEMLFMRRCMEASTSGSSVQLGPEEPFLSIPSGTWNCLQSTITLCDPILVFPVVDHQSYAPLPGLFRCATGDASLPSPGMIRCIRAAGGQAPTEWDDVSQQYYPPQASKGSKQPVQLRDALLMKPGSTVQDVFLTLKRLGALSGEFIRAEVARDLHGAAKPAPKGRRLSSHTRIIKIMTNKKSAWQSA